MADNGLEGLTESAKAVQEVAKVSGKIVDVSRDAAGVLYRLFGQGVEDLVALHWSDRLRARRIEAAIYDWARLMNLIRKVNARLDAKGITALRDVPPNITLSLIENATTEYDDDLHTLWAQLLASGLDASADQIQRKFVSVLSELTREDAVVFTSIYLSWCDPENKYRGKHSYGSLTYGPSVDGTASHNPISVITLNRLGLVTPAYTEFRRYEPGRDLHDYWGVRSDEMRAYGDLEVVEVTEFGVAFYKAVMAD